MNIRTLGSALRSGHWPTLLGAWLHLTVSFMVWLLFGALAVAIGEDLLLTATQLSVLVALPLLSGALLRVATGWSCDWYGAKRTVCWCWGFSWRRSCGPPLVERATASCWASVFYWAPGGRVLPSPCRLPAGSIPWPIKVWCWGWSRQAISERCWSSYWLHDGSRQWGGMGPAASWPFPF